MSSVVELKWMRPNGRVKGGDDGAKWLTRDEMEVEERKEGRKGEQHPALMLDCCCDCLSNASG